jgi:hypothetical protein
MLPVAAPLDPRATRPRQTHTALAALIACFAAASCSAPPGALPINDDDDDGVPEFVGSVPGQVNPGAAPTGTTPPPAASGNGGVVPNPAAPEQNPANGAPIAGSNTGNANMGGANTGSAGAANAGAGGAGMAAGNDLAPGAGGSSMGVAGSASMLPAEQPIEPTPIDPAPVNPAPVNPAPAEPAQPDPVTPPVVTPPAAPVGPDIPCPADATFCSGFEGATLPAGTNFVIGGDSSFANQFALDTAVARSGQQSFMIPGPSPGFSYRALTIPAPGQDFWARLYVQVDTEFGDGNHDALFGASDADQQSDHNNEVLIELSEQFGYMLLNTDDCALQCNTPAPELQLAPAVWHCMEAHYDANAGHVEVFLEGERFIDSVGPQYNLSFQTFRIGYMRFNTERTVRYDDVVVAPTRVGCD